jgi:hypothetical protein
MQLGSQSVMASGKNIFGRSQPTNSTNKVQNFKKKRSRYHAANTRQTSLTKKCEDDPCIFPTVAIEHVQLRHVFVTHLMVSHRSVSRRQIEKIRFCLVLAVSAGLCVIRII